MVRMVHTSADLPAAILVSVKGDPTIATAPGARPVTIDLGSGFHRGLWALQLDKAVGESRDQVVIVAHGVACLAAAWWAQLSPRSYLKSVAGAVFHAPLALTMGQAAIARSLWPSPATKLPFPSVVAAGGSMLVEHTLMLADNWGSRFVAADAPDCIARSDVRDIGAGIEAHLVDLLALFGGESAPAAAAMGSETPAIHLVR